MSRAPLSSSSLSPSSLSSSSLSSSSLSSAMTPTPPRRFAWATGFGVAVLFLLLPKLPFPQLMTYPLAPSLAAILVFCWALDNNSPTGALSVFVLGLLEDALVGAPTGSWALGFGVIYLGAWHLRPLVRSTRAMSIAVFAGLGIAAFVLLWLVHGLKAGAFMPFGSVLLSWAATCACFPLVIIGLRLVQNFVYLGVPATKQL